MKTNLDYEQVDRFKEILDKCTKCGFCMSNCPVYREELIESSVARGNRRAATFVAFAASG